MVTLFYDDFDKICRGCLCKTGEMRPIFGSSLDNMLSNVADINVKCGDGLPELMCVPCVLQVSRAFTFKQQCRRSDQTLRSFLVELEKLNASDDIRNEVDDSEAINKQEHLNSETPPSNESISDNLNTEIVLETLSTHVNSNQFSEQIIDSNLPIPHIIEAANDNEQIQLNADEHLIQHEIQHTDDKDVSDAKLNEYLDDIKLDVAEVVSLEGTEIEADSIESTFDDIPSQDDDSIDEKQTDDTDDLILNILSAEEQKTDIEVSFCCSMCTSNFNTENDLESHVQSTHSVALSNEKPENDVTIQTSDINENLSKNKFKCPECPKSFAENKILKRHLKIHSPIKPHVCNICDMSFAESSNLSKHMKKHTGELRNVVGKPNLCSVCGKGFKWASSLSKHMKHHTRHKILNCPYCPKYYVEARSLNIHMRSHTGEKPFVCPTCSKGFTQMGNLEKHIRVHTGEKPYCCPICKKGFSQSGYVAIHLRTHTGEKPYICEDCGKAFAGSNTLAIHKRTHTGERPYPCSVCDKTFARQETAIIHQRTHTGERPFTCSLCNRGFTSSGHLTGHMRSHNGIKTHECKVCQKRFAGSSSLKVHMKTHNDKNAQAQQQTEQSFDDKTTTVFECNMCKMNIPSSVLTSPDVLLQAYNHEVIDDVLICSNVTSIIDNDKIIEEIQDENGSNIILTTTSDTGSSQQLLINLSDLK